MKNKYEIRTTEQCPSFKQPPDSSQLNLGKVTTWRSINSMPASLHRQTPQNRHTATESQRCPSRSTNPKAKTPVEDRMSVMTAYGTKCGLLERTSSRASSCLSPTFAKNESEIRELKFKSLDDELEKLIQQIIDEQHIAREDIIKPNLDAEDHLSRKEVVMETPCQQTEIVRERLHLYLPTHDVQEEEEFTITGEPPEDVLQNLAESNGDLKEKQNYKNTKTKQEEKNGCCIKDSAWAYPPNNRLKDQMQGKLTRAWKSLPAPAVNVNSIEQNTYSEILEDPWNRLNHPQPLKDSYANRRMVDLTIYDLEAELYNIHNL
ncbi:uncharacterized protein LOC144503086 [Mustelus asterias]